MPAYHARVKELFLAVLEMPAAGRAGYLDTACAGDTALRQQLEIMLRSQENSGELLPRPPAELLADSGATDADATAALALQPQGSPTSIEGGPTDGADSLSFLEPSDKPGHLGRLGHYEIWQVIGRGGFGIVLKGFDERLHRVVAIKVLSPAYAANGSARKRFIREAQTAAAVKNEHVVGIYDVEKDAQPPYLAMELIDGISLQDKLDKKGPLSLKEILRIGLQTAEGLAAAHKQGLVHRDIKPANILLENGVERVKITDFGLARAVDDASVTQSGTVAGTPMYMSPEQAEGLQVDHRSDLFSLGTVLYAMCTGHPPFRASGTHAVLKRVIDASPRPICEINNEIPDWLADIIAKLHAKRPEDRFQSAKEVAELLGQRLADMQAGRAPIVNVPKPVLPPEPTSTRPQWTKGLALAGMGAVFTYGAVMLFRLDADRISPPGVQWFVAIEGLGMLLSGVFLAIQSVATVQPAAPAKTPSRVPFGTKIAVLIMGIVGLGLVSTPYALDIRAPVDILFALTGFSICVIGLTILVMAVVATRRWVKLMLLMAVLLGGACIPVCQYLLRDRQAGGRPGLVPPDRQIDGRWESDWGPVWLEHVPIHGDNKAVTVKGYFIPEPKKKGTVTEGTYDPTQGTLRLSLSEPWRLGTSSAQLKLSSDGQKLEGTWKNDAGESGIWTMIRSRTNIPPQPDEKDDPAGWAPLFNGTDLTGWKKRPGQHGNWQVVNGILVGSDATTFLLSERGDYRDFHLRMEAAVNSGGYGGAFFRIPESALPKGDGIPEGFYTQINATRTDVNRTGSLFGNHVKPFAVVPTEAATPKANEWFVMEIIAKGRAITIKLNGQTSVDYIDTRGNQPVGHLALLCMDGNTAVKFRKIEIKELTPTAVSPDANSDLKRLQGKWKVSTVEQDGTKVSPSETNRWNFQDGEYSLRVGNQLQEGKVRLDPAKRPSAIDLTVTHGPDLGKSYRGVYKFVNDDLWLIFPRNTDLDRPTTLSGNAGNGQIFTVLKRDPSVQPEPPAPDQKPKGPAADPSWIPLFNGKDLAGWKTLPGKKADWKVEAGELIGRSSPESLLFSESGNYQDFHLKAEVKLNAEGNSGVLFRTKFEDAPGDAITGYEADLDFIRGTPSSPIGTLWKDSKRVQRALKSAAVPDQWFSMEVIAKGPRIQVLVNGQNVVDFTDAAEDSRKGHIALQAFGENTMVRFRKIELKEISPSK